MAHVITDDSPPARRRKAVSIYAIFTWPTAVSFFRIIMIPFIIYYKSIGEHAIAAFLTFIAGISDAVDGFLAELLNAKTKFGAWIDPIADKLLHLIIFYFIPIIGLITIITEIVGKQLSTPVREYYKKKGDMHYIAPYSKGITFWQILALVIFCLYADYELYAAISIAALSVWRLLIYKAEYNRVVADGALNRFDTVPNYITITGLYLIPLILYVYSLDLAVSMRWIVMVLYCFIAWPTDFFDGLAAKLLNQRSHIGEVLDTVRDVGLTILGMWMFDREAILWLIPSQSLTLYFYSRIKKITHKHVIPKLSRIITFALAVILGLISLHTYWIEVDFLGIFNFLRSLIPPERLKILIIILPVGRAMVYGYELVEVILNKERYQIAPYNDER